MIFALKELMAHRLPDSANNTILFRFCFLVFLLRSHLKHMEVLRLRVELELQLQAYTTATAMPYP